MHYECIKLYMGSWLIIVVADMCRGEEINALNADWNYIYGSQEGSNQKHELMPV